MRRSGPPSTRSRYQSPATLPGLRTELMYPPLVNGACCTGLIGDTREAIEKVSPSTPTRSWKLSVLELVDQRHKELRHVAPGVGRRDLAEITPVVARQDRQARVRQELGHGPRMLRPDDVMIADHDQRGRLDPPDIGVRPVAKGLHATDVLLEHVQQSGRIGIDPRVRVFERDRKSTRLH